MNEGQTGTGQTYPEVHCSPYEVLGWAWAEACSRLDKGEDPRKIEMPLVMLRFNEAFKANTRPDRQEGAR